MLTFGVGGRRYAIDASEVAEVILAPPITRVPQAPPALKGVANVRGRAAPIVAVEQLLGDAATATRTGAGARVIMLGGAAPVGLAVDEINAVREVAARASQVAASTEVIETAEGPLRVLQPQALLATAFAGTAQRRLGARAEATSTDPTAPRATEAAFLEFRLSGQAYAVALNEVREVSRVPAAIQALPGADAAMLGLINLRERLLPIISAASVLGLAAEAPGPAARVVVLAVGETEIGLLVDAVRGVRRERADRVAAAPAILNRAAGEARIDAILRTDAGLVSILATERVLNDATVAGLLAQTTGQTAPMSEREAGEAMQRFVIFRLGDEVYGLPIEDVEAVIRLPETITRVPGAPAFVAGVINHRGRVTPLVDQGMRFSTATVSTDARRRVIVASLDGLCAGFIVDAVDQVVSIPERALQAAPELATGDAGVFDRIASVEHGGALVLLVDPRQLLDQAERDILRALATDADTRPSS